MTGVSDVNRKLWTSPKIVRFYGSAELFSVEARIFAHLKEEFRGKAILDLGVGTGRTTPHLVEISQNYIGADYSATMVAACTQKYPGVRFICCDARSMTPFEDGQFDFVVFSFNGIDTMAHNDRLKVLAEVLRVMAPDGIFVFASHNRAFNVRRAYDPRNFRLTPNPLRLAKRMAEFFQGMANHLRLGRYETESAEYAIRNDNAHNYSLLFYYISAGEQRRQLERAGYTEVAAFDMDGNPPGTDRRPDLSWMIYYTARRRR